MSINIYWYSYHHTERNGEVVVAPGRRCDMKKPGGEAPGTVALEEAGYGPEDFEDVENA